ALEDALDVHQQTIDELTRQLRQRPQPLAAAAPAAPRTAVPTPAPPLNSDPELRPQSPTPISDPELRPQTPTPPPQAPTPPSQRVAPPPAVTPPSLPPPPPPEPPQPPRALVPFDWEDVVGVRLFSAVAGVALVLAAVFFLKYSIDHGWLAPPVRVAIGIAVATALLVAL